MDEQEVERVARLMHDMAIEYHQFFGDIEGKTVATPWERLPPHARERYVYVARAVIADLCAVSTAIVTEV